MGCVDVLKACVSRQPREACSRQVTTPHPFTLSNNFRFTPLAAGLPPLARPPAVARRAQLARSASRTPRARRR